MINLIGPSLCSIVFNSMMCFCVIVASHAPHNSYGRMVVVHSLKVHTSSFGLTHGIVALEFNAYEYCLSLLMRRLSMMELMLVLSRLCYDTIFVEIVSAIVELNRW